MDTFIVHQSHNLRTLTLTRLVLTQEVVSTAARYSLYWSVLYLYCTVQVLYLYCSPRTTAVLACSWVSRLRRHGSSSPARLTCSTVQYSTVQYNTVQYSTVQYSAGEAARPEAIPGRGQRPGLGPGSRSLQQQLGGGQRGLAVIAARHQEDLVQGRLRGMRPV